MKTFSVIGAGRAGRAVAKLMREAGWKIRGVTCRTLRSARAARRFIGAGRAGTGNLEAIRGADLVIVGVPDRRIAPVWKEIFPHLARGTVAFHLCGNEPSTLLSPAGEARVGSVHPMKSFADPALAVKTFRGTYCGVEGPPLLERLVRAWGGVPLRVDPGSKALYHAAAVFATNYVVADLDAAVDLLVRAKVPRRRALEAVVAMASGTVRNLSAVGLPRALTGPIERGDVDTVRRHLDALAALDRKLLESYTSLGRRACRIAREKGTPKGCLRRIERLLAKEHPDR